MAETDRENIRKATLKDSTPPPAGATTAASSVITVDMLHTVLRRRACGESVADIARI